MICWKAVSYTHLFGSKVRLDAGKRRGKIIIEYTSNDDLERILAVSYTHLDVYKRQAENMCEINSHGGNIVVQKICNIEN